MIFCILMLNQMHQTQDVINTPCVAAFDKSQVKKNKFLDHQDVELIKWNISPHVLWIVGTVSWSLSSAWLPSGLVFQWQMWFPNVDWFSEERIKTSVDQRDEHQIHQLHVCQLVLIQMFHALLEHFCTGKTWKKKLLAGMFLQNFPRYFRLFTSSLFSVLLNY